MDTMPPASETTARLVPLDQIHDDGDDMRRVKAPDLADAMLVASIRRYGVLEPIGVRPNGNGYRIAFGRRRLRCARAAGLAEIPASIQDWTDEQAREAQAAENLHRHPLHPVDVWCTVSGLVDQGCTIAEAAAALCLDERETRRMERLGRLDPALLKLVEIEMPREHQLRAIANASAKVQKAALRGLGTKPTDSYVPWYEIAKRCEVQRVTRAYAIFDTAAHPALWEEDLFAEPNDPERFTTTDIARFLKLQQEALAARVEQQRAAKHRVQLAEFDAAKHTAAIPAGFRLVSVNSGSKPKRTECVFTAVAPDGRIVEALAEDVAAKRAAEKQQKAKDRELAKEAAAAPDAPDDARAEAGTDDDDAPADAAAPAKSPLTKAGLAAVAAAKTNALRATLRFGLAELPLERVIALLPLGLTASNVEVRMDAGEGPEDWHQRQRWRCFEDIAATLLLPGGGLAELNAAEARRQAGDALARILKVGAAGGSYSADSGPAAEWIGAAIGAGQAVGRFDTAEFLAHVNGETLRQVATAAGLKATGPVGALRERLAGQMAGWLPDAAAFGAPAPEG